MVRRGLHADGHHAPLSYHGGLLLDPHRMDAYERAIRALVRPGDVVLDVGTGTGVLAMLAARRGARVHAVESMPVAELARELVAHNGLADRVTVHRADLRAMAPIEPVDLVLGEYMGAFLVDDFMLPAVAAAARWLKPGGRWSPARVRLWLAPADVGVRELEVWRAPFYGVDLAPAHAHALAECHRVDVGPGVLLAGGEAVHDFVPPGPLAWGARGRVRGGARGTPARVRRLVRRRAGAGDHAVDGAGGADALGPVPVPRRRRRGGGRRPHRARAGARRTRRRPRVALVGRGAARRGRARAVRPR